MNVSFDINIPDDASEEQLSLCDGVTLQIFGAAIPAESIIYLLLRAAEQVKIQLALAGMPDAGGADEGMVDALAMLNARMGLVDDIMHLPALNHLELDDQR